MRNKIYLKMKVFGRLIIQYFIILTMENLTKRSLKEKEKVEMAKKKRKAANTAESTGSTGNTVRKEQTKERSGALKTPRMISP